MTVRTVEVDGARVDYGVAGEGPVIVLVKNSKHPVDFPVAQQLANNFCTFQIQPVGFGASDRPLTYDFGSIDRQVLAVLDEKRVEDFVVWGFSQPRSWPLWSHERPPARSSLAGRTSPAILRMQTCADLSTSPGCRSAA